mgnify:CR=1 FL=1
MQELTNTVKYLLDELAPATIPAILVTARNIIQNKTKKNKQKGGRKNIKGGFGKEMVQDAVTELYKVAPAALLVAAQRYLGKSKKQKGGSCQSSACSGNQRLLYSTEGKLQCDNAAARGGQRMNYSLPQKGGANKRSKKKRISIK